MMIVIGAIALIVAAVVGFAYLAIKASEKGLG